MVYHRLKKPIHDEELLFLTDLDGFFFVIPRVCSSSQFFCFRFFKQDVRRTRTIKCYRWKWLASREGSR